MTQEARNAPRSSVRRLSRDLIVTTALAQVDSRGASGLSMRTLAQELDVEAMSLYRYVNGKEDLLEGIVRLLMHDLLAALQDASTEHWQSFLQITAHEVRRIAVELMRSGGVPGLHLAHLREDAFQHYVVDRFRGARGEERIYLRPKVPFGAR